MTDRRIYVRKASMKDMPAIIALQERVYREEGYLPSGRAASTHLDTPFCDPNLTETFIALRAQEHGCEELVGTLSMSEIDTRGAPSLEQDFPRFKAQVATQEGKICILWRYIVIPSCRKNFRAAMLLIMEALAVGRRRGITEAYCAVNPEKHESFYEDKLGFVEVDRCKNLSGFINAPAVLLSAQVETLHARYHPLIERITVLHHDLELIA